MPSTQHFAFSVGWIVISAFSYGYHISALNGAQDAISCRSNRARPDDQALYPSLSLLTPCIAMSDTLFGLLTSSYTVGGFVGSMYASRVATGRGNRRTLVLSALAIAGGSLVMALANMFVLLLLGRTLVGVGCGLTTVLVPLSLADVAPSTIRGAIGVTNQLAIVLGIFAAQILSLPLATAFRWRWIFAFSALVSLLQLVLAPLLAADLAADPSSDRSDDDDPLDFEHEALLAPAHSIHLQPPSVPPLPPLSLAQLLRDQPWKLDPALASGLAIVLITQLAQQLSGINAVLYYSTSIMKSVLPTKALYISIFVTAINVLMTFPALFLVDKLGRKRLLVLSAGMMAGTSLVLGVAINHELAHLSSLAIVLFVASFSLGLGPIPFVILSEVVPAYAVSAAGSLGLALNWAANFLVGLAFLPLRNRLATPDGDGDGNVFFIFTGLGALSTLLILRQFPR
ncbi:hypothetical protein PTTG_07093 [Puccinia triticina 1-1 BBBD Race 1]|uniref:MFS domain-containing protein n=2 Tax=Puccinia triticina TaxID=208348 RepID=A0A0C4EVU6_PUCT1|nr:hypothetical protein PTTG_07093 [Puccinia triticina 1-1 BBBD Race 1]